MNSAVRKELDNRLREIRAELTAISETKVVPTVDLPDREDRLLDELDDLEFDLGIHRSQGTHHRLQQNTRLYLMSSNITHRCQLCGKEVTSDSKALPTGWIHLSIAKAPDGSGNTAILCDLCSTKSDAAAWVLARQRKEPKQIMK
jgi:hypothetical protein